MVMIAVGAAARQGLVKGKGKNLKLTGSVVGNQGDSGISLVPPPAYISFHLTDECDGRCLHCDIWRRRGVSPMPKNALGPILRSISKWLGPVEIQVAGGEPLISENAPVFLEECARLFLPVTLTTNGLGLDDEWAGRLTRWNLRHVNFSLDGFSELHDRIRGVPGSFRMVLEAASRIAGWGVVSPRATCVIMKDNLEQLVAFTRFVCGDLFDGVFFQAMAQPFGQPPKRGWWRDHFLWPDDQMMVEHVLGKLLELKHRGLPILNPVEQFGAMRAYFQNPERFSLAACTVGERGLTIEPDGSVRLCPMEEPIGNVLEKDIRDIWHSAAAAQCRKKMADCRTNCHLLINCVFDRTQFAGEEPCSS